MYLVSLFLKVDKIRTNVRKSAIDRSIAGLYISNSTTRHQRRESKGNVYRQKSSAKRNLIHLRNIECWLARSRIWKQASRQASKQINEWFWFEYHVFLVGARNWLDPRRLSPRGIIYEYKERKIKMKNFLPLAGWLPACLPACSVRAQKMKFLLFILKKNCFGFDRLSAASSIYYYFIIVQLRQ